MFFIPRITDKQQRTYDLLGLSYYAECLCLLPTVRRCDGKVVALVCATKPDPQGNVQIIPLAEIIEGKADELYHSPINNINTDQDSN